MSLIQLHRQSASLSTNERCSLRDQWLTQADLSPAGTVTDTIHWHDALASDTVPTCFSSIPAAATAELWLERRKKTVTIVSPSP